MSKPSLLRHYGFASGVCGVMNVKFLKLKTLMTIKGINVALLILGLLPGLVYASSTLPADFFYKIYLIEFIFIVLGLLTSQFLPLKNGYSSTAQRIAFGVGGVLLGLVSAALILKLGIIKI